MSYFKEFPLIDYPSRFEEQFSNEDYVKVVNLFRRAKLREDFANSVTAFNLYQIKDGERPDQLAEKLYDDPSLDWVVLIANNITNINSNWPLTNEDLQEYLIDKYETEDNLDDIRYIETTEVKDEYDRIVIPEKLIIDSDLYQEFTTISNKSDPLLYDLKYYPVPSKYRDLEVTSNLGQYIEVWERNNLEEGQQYTGEKYILDSTRLQQNENPDEYEIDDRIFPENSRSDYSYLFVYSRQNNIKYIYSPITLQGWPGKWGGEMPIYLRTNENEFYNVELLPIITDPINITDDLRLYTISSSQGVGEFTYTSGTRISSESSQTYIIDNPPSSRDGKNSKFEVKRNSLGEIISVKNLVKGKEYVKNEIIIIPGNLIGGENIKDNLEITITEIYTQPQFRFISIG